MKIFDFNIHLPYIKNEDVNIVIKQDLKLSINDLIKGFETHKDCISKCEGANFLLFNTKLFNENVSGFFNVTSAKLKIARYTALIDFRDPNVFNYLNNVKESGAHAIMFNSYLQKISESDFTDILKVCQFAAKKKLIICIDGSYGTSKMYEYDNLKLACAVSDLINDTPIVIVHSGGYRLIEAMLLAADKKNVWLDTSFSLPYYIGSSIEQDFAFIMKQMNCDRIIFGSDHPYIDFEKALNDHLLFFNKYDFCTNEQEKIFFHNANELFQ